MEITLLEFMIIIIVEIMEIIIVEFMVITMGNHGEIIIVEFYGNNYGKSWRLLYLPGKCRGMFGERSNAYARQQCQ